jgi:tripartite-type tricarboxylate transporter receptor subunit TctC
MPLRPVSLALAFALLLSISATARAEYPERPIRMIVPFPPGGVTDVVARLVAERFTAEFGQQVIVDNKAGAGSVIGTDIVAKAPPDGYTILFTTPGHTINAAFRTSLPYDTEKDFAPVSIAGRVPMLLVSHPSLPVTDYKGFIAYAKANPGKINVSHAGNGTLPHVQMALLMVKEQIQVTSVPYRGAAPALADLVAGQVQAKLDNYTTAQSFVAQKKLNALAFTSAKRQKQLPDVPTVMEMGVADFEGYLWMGIVMPTGTPQTIVDKLAAASRRAVALPETLARFDKDGIEPVGNTPADFRSLISHEIGQWRELATQTRITIE